jgi:O-antigen/teichoic acid export membrane protein
MAKTAGSDLALPSRVLMFMAFAGMSVVNYAFGLAAGWLLAPGDFGLLAFTMTVLTVAGLLLSSGFAWSLTHALVDANTDRRAALVRGAAAANLLIALAISAGVLLLFSMGPLRRGLETWTVAALVAATLLPLSLLTITRAAAQGNERYGALATLLVMETIIKAAAGLGLVLLGFGAAGAVAGFMVGSLGTALVGVVYLRRKLGVSLRGEMRFPQFGMAGGMFAALLGLALLLNLDIIALKLFSVGDRAEVGRYQAGIVLANMPYYLLMAMIPILFNQVARTRQLSKTLPHVVETLQLALIVLLPIEMVPALYPQAFLGLLFPAVYASGAATLRILAGGNSAIMLVAILSATFQAAGKPWIAGRVLLAVAACEAILLRIVAPNQHGIGVATIFLLATTSALLILGVIYWSRLGVRPSGQVLAWLVRYVGALAAGALAGTGVMALTGNLYVALILAGVAYLAAVLALKLVSVVQLRQATTRPPVASGGE